LPEGVIQQINELIKLSLEYAYTHYPTLSDYIKGHAQEMDEAVMRQHIELYVNEFTLELGETGKEAIEQFYQLYQQQSGTQPVPLFA
jgi:1,4-dihydroxy-6-naphthoate synthase